MTLTLAVYEDPAAAEQRANAYSPSEPDEAALVPFVALPSPSIPHEPISAVPLAFAAPNDERAEPWWLRTKLFQHLHLRFDLPVHFIAEKAVTVTDLDRHQNRFRLPSDGVMRNLRPVLTPLELACANLLHEEAPRPRPPKQHQQQQPQLLDNPDNAPAAGEIREKKRKRKGKKHGGLPVLVVDLIAGIRELQLSRWDSSGGTIIKGEGYLDFIAQCSFTVDDVVEVWAFKDRTYRYFGVDLCVESPLYVLITKKGQTQRPAV
ncbi:hypothetical protein BRADI_2g46440v3 [Brachypodium distachyon]|uniref:Uncharacterized protein n=1 Tax=Brachypodium distachyon TaxID=15368 RepID=A0A0Q3ITT8_BRADI|nr:hypothetical protein BRADI_2g46440v3 [Brachypodium distachyon]